MATEVLTPEQMATLPRAVLHKYQRVVQKETAPAQPGAGEAPAQPGAGEAPAQPGAGEAPAQPGAGEAPAQPGAAPAADAVSATTGPVQGEGNAIPPWRDLDATPPSMQPDDAGTYKHKYDVLRGKYEAETERLRREAEAARAEIERIKSERAEEERSAIARMAREEIAAMTDGQFQEYFNLTDAQMAVGRETLEPALAGAAVLVKKTIDGIIDKHVRPLRDMLERENERKFADALDRLAPGWDKLNDNDDFIAYLSENDGALQSMLNAAWAGRNADGVALIVNAYRQSRGLPVRGVAAIKTPVSAQVTPKGAAASGRPPKQAETAYSMDEFMQFTKDVGRGKVPPDQVEKQFNEWQRRFRAGLVQ